MEKFRLTTIFQDITRNEGIHIVSSRGSGKSSLLGRFLAYDDFENKIPLVIFDNGDTIDALYDQVRTAYELVKMWYTAAEVTGRADWSEWLGTLTEWDEYFEKEFLERVLYVDLAGVEWNGVNPGKYVFPFPMYYQLHDESVFTISQRFVDVIRRIDPSLESASVQGYNPLWQIATHGGKILAVLGFQITEMLDLILHTENWGENFKKAKELDPSVSDSVDFFTIQYPKWPEQWRASLTRKLTLFTASDYLKAMFGASTPGIDWQDVVDNRKIVLFDFRNIHDDEVSRFLMTWLYRNLQDFILRRGVNPDPPISIIIDELSMMVNSSDPANSYLFEKDLDRMLNTIMRRYNVWLTVAHQSMNQFSDAIQALLLGMETQMIGKIGTIEEGLHLAKNLMPVDVDAVKRTNFIPVRVGFGQMAGYEARLDEDDFTIPEQHYYRANLLTGHPKFFFLVLRLSKPFEELWAIDISEFMKMYYESHTPTAKGKQYFRWYQEAAMSLYGRKVPDILSEIDKRLPGKIAPQEKPKSQDQPQKETAKVKIVGKKLND